MASSDEYSRRKPYRGGELEAAWPGLPLRGLLLRVGSNGRGSRKGRRLAAKPDGRVLLDNMALLVSSLSPILLHWLFCADFGQSESQLSGIQVKSAH